MVLDTFLIIYVGVLVNVTQHTQKITCKKYKLHKTLGDRNLNFGKYLLCKAKKNTYKVYRLIWYFHYCQKSLYVHVYFKTKDDINALHYTRRKVHLWTVC